MPEQNINSVIKKQWILLNMALDDKEDYDIQDALNEQLIWAINQEAYEYLRLKKDAEEMREEGTEPGALPERSGPAVDPHVKKVYEDIKVNTKTQVGVTDA